MWESGQIFRLLQWGSVANYNLRFEEEKTASMILIFFFFKNHEKFQISLDRLLGNDFVHAECRSKNRLQFHGEMKYHFHRQLPLRFCVLVNFCTNAGIMTAFCPSGPSKIVNFRGRGKRGQAKNFYRLASDRHTFALPPLHISFPRLCLVGQ